jgi:hypothetical protein
MTPTTATQYTYPVWLDKAREKWDKAHAVPQKEKPYRTARNITLEYTDRDLRVRIQGEKPKHVTSTRKEIKCYSQASSRRFRHRSRAVGYEMKSCGGLTYPKNFPHDGRLIESHKRALFKRIQRRYPSAKFVWVKELQKRNAVHYHFMCTTFIDKDFLSRAWYEVVGSGDTKHLKAGTSIEPIYCQNGLSNYFGNYMQKQEQKIIPGIINQFGRFWGMSRSLFVQTVITFTANTKPQWDFIRYMRRAYGAALKKHFGHRWKRRNNAAGFLAWGGRDAFEQYRGHFQTSTLTA